MRSKVGPVKIAMWLAMVAVVLATVNLISIPSGPSADDAMVAFRVAQSDLFEAKKRQRGMKTPALNEAEAALNLAWAALTEKRYDGAILEARRVSELARKVKG